MVIVRSATARRAEAKESIWLRAACFFICIPSVGALLAKLYSIASMKAVALSVAVPASAGLVGILVWAKRSRRKQLADRLAIGVVGGLLATVAYDLIRIPFHMAGLRIFAPISAFGVWLADATCSSRFTEVIGWSYHYWNGITFGIMYALFARNRHWGWAIMWACLLETIAILSPFGRIFSLLGNYSAIGIAYLGHVAYGVPLGLMVYRWDATRDYLAGIPVLVKWILVLICCAAIVGPMVSPDWVERDSTAVSGEFRVEGHRLNPDWLRIHRGEEIRVYNPEPDSVSVVVKQHKEAMEIGSGQKEVLAFHKPGIYQVYVETGRRSRSSFVIVEPVEAPE